MRSFGNFCVAPVLGSSCTTCTLRSCAPYAPINSSKYLCFERSLIIILIPAPYSLLSITTTFLYKKTHEKATKKATPNVDLYFPFLVIPLVNQQKARFTRNGLPNRRSRIDVICPCPKF
ncbi:MAG: hypothetical protein LBJ16_03775 [Holosporaceae bacterium]|nr:hypothetical protein [Holosporaceae bacterium]